MGCSRRLHGPPSKGHFYKFAISGIINLRYYIAPPLILGATSDLIAEHFSTINQTEVGAALWGGIVKAPI
jgi:hypothetical protein